MKAKKNALLVWPEICLATCWIALFFVTDVLSRDDESVIHRLAHLTLWLSLACYVVIAIRQHRSADT